MTVNLTYVEDEEVGMMWLQMLEEKCPKQPQELVLLCILTVFSITCFCSPRQLGAKVYILLRLI